MRDATFLCEGAAFDLRSTNAANRACERRVSERRIRNAPSQGCSPRSCWRPPCSRQKPHLHGTGSVGPLHYLPSLPNERLRQSSRSFRWKNMRPSNGPQAVPALYDRHSSCHKPRSFQLTARPNLRAGTRCAIAAIFVCLLQAAGAHEQCGLEFKIMMLKRDSDTLLAHPALAARNSRKRSWHFQCVEILDPLAHRAHAILGTCADGPRREPLCPIWTPDGSRQNDW